MCGGGEQGRVYAVPEMQLGTGAAYVYAECGDCGSLGLRSAAPTAAEEYPEDYYAHEPVDADSARRWGARYRDWLTAPDLRAKALFQNAWGAYAAVARLALPLSSRVLDIGCGSGDLLWALFYAGFTEVRGEDPMLPDAGLQASPFPLQRGPPEGGESRYDLIMFHHSLEHTSDPCAALQSAARRLAPGGRMLVRLPMIPCEAWRQFRVSWVQLDAPRHRFVPSEDGFRMMAHRAGLRVEDLRRDASAFQFWASRQYRRRIPLRSRRSLVNSRWRRLLHAALLLMDAYRTDRVNRAGQGDQACAILAREGA